MHLPFQPPKDKYSNSNKSVPLTRKRIEKNVPWLFCRTLMVARIASYVTNCIGTDSEIIDTRYVRAAKPARANKWRPVCALSQAGS